MRRTCACTRTFLCVCAWLWLCVRDPRHMHASMHRWGTYVHAQIGKHVHVNERTHMHGHVHERLQIWVSIFYVTDDCIEDKWLHKISCNCSSQVSRLKKDRTHQVACFDFPAKGKKCTNTLSCFSTYTNAVTATLKTSIQCSASCLQYWMGYQYVQNTWQVVDGDASGQGVSQYTQQKVRIVDLIIVTSA